MRTINKVIKIVCFTLLGLCGLVAAYFVAFFVFNATYVNYCNLRGAQQNYAFQTVVITDSTYRLGGMGRIGVGASRQQVINSVERRNTLIRLFGDDIPPSRYVFLDEPLALPGATLGFYRVRTWNA
ncbi:MAG: hypothetical protein FWG38_05980, partial [Defluviitaleaceae bacterium]|nr:hypothetical protein [Defluviitaleaceae bacterium]